MTFRPVDSPLRPVDIQGYVAFRPVDSPYYDRSIYRSISHFDRSILYYDRSIYKSIRHFDRSVYRSIYRSLSHIDRSIIKSWLSIMAAIMAPMCNIHHYLLHQHPLKNGANTKKQILDIDIIGKNTLRSSSCVMFIHQVTVKSQKNENILQSIMAATRCEVFKMCIGCSS